MIRRIVKRISWRSIPSEWQGVYNTLKTDTTDFSASMDSKWGTVVAPGATHPSFKSCADGYLTANYWNMAHNPSNYIDGYVKPFLLALRNLGFAGVRIQIGYPLLDPVFWEWVTSQGYDRNQLSNLQTNFSDVITYAHSIGLAVLVQSQTIENARGATWHTDTYMASQTWAAYKLARAAHINAVHDLPGLMTTDPISVQSEATNEATHSGQAELLDPAANAVFLQSVMDAVDAAGNHASGEKYYAGAGVWYGTLATQLANLYAIPNLDGIDLHTYPINSRIAYPFTPYWTTWQNASASVNAHGKLLMASETDMMKEADAEVGAVPGWDMFPRRHFSFWEPLDKSFRWSAVRMGHLYKYQYMSVSWPSEMIAWLPYQTGLTTDEMDARYAPEFLAALAAGRTTGLGDYMKKLNVKQWATP